MADAAGYTPETSFIAINKIPLNLGRAAGTYTTFTYDVPAQWVAFAGVDGAGYYNKNRSRAATMTVSVLPNSEENTILGDLLLAQNVSPVALRWPVLVTRGQSKFEGFGVVQGQPPIEMSDGVETVVWTIISTRMIGRTFGEVPAILGPA